MLALSAAVVRCALDPGHRHRIPRLWRAIETGATDSEPAFDEPAPEATLHQPLVDAVVDVLETSPDAAHTALAPYTFAHLNVQGLDAIGEDPAALFYDRARENGLPHSLKGIGASLGDLPRIADAARERGLALDQRALVDLLDAAYHARRPAHGTRRVVLPGFGPHASLQVTVRGAPLEHATAVLIAIHGRGAAADRITRDFEAHLPKRDGLAILAPQALDNTWYPKGFTVPVQQNQPFFDGALAMVDACWAAATLAGVPADRVVLAGFSQGGCLLLSWARLRAHRPAALLALSAAELDVPGDYESLSTSQVTVSKSERDPWIPQERFDRTAAALRGVVEDLEIRLEPGDTHAVYEADGRALARAVWSALCRG